jgi:phage/plasmid-associated DNA primase
VAKLLELILNKQYHQCDKSIFIKTGKSSKGSATPETMDLIARRMSVYSEGETSDKIEMNMAGIKGISGEDPITGRHLYGNQITFRAYTKLHMLTNFTPPTNAEVAIKERLRYIFLDSQFVNNPDPKVKNQFKIDKDFTDKLETVYLSEIFSWIVLGAKEFYKDNKIEMSPEFEKRTEDILSSEDSIKTFIDRKLKITNDFNDKITKSELFQFYNNFCSENSQRCQPRSTLFNRLEHMNLKLYTLNGYDIYRGMIVVDFKNDEEDNDVDHRDKIIKSQYEEIVKLKLEVNRLKVELQNQITDDDLEKELELLMK